MSTGLSISEECISNTFLAYRGLSQADAAHIHESGTNVDGCKIEVL
jgi:hypothetical protein